jgi:hypothetical protein
MRENQDRRNRIRSNWINPKEGIKMKEKVKGLCVNCIEDRGCTFPRQFPVWQCEEFKEEAVQFLPPEKKSKKNSDLCDESAKFEMGGA